ncbi:MAG: PSD1 and planctomycete cytochrome C domain-containing protein [Planctomycetia bacterium]
MNHCHTLCVPPVVWAAVCAISLVSGGRAWAEDPPDFVRDVRPILERRCLSCHSGEQPKGGLRLDVKAAAFAGGDGHGPAILPGNPDESPLIRLVRGDDPDERMPPPESGGGAVSEGELATLVAWIRAGGSWPDGVDTARVADRMDHWAFKPVVRHPPPAVRDHGWPRNEIDRFLLARLESEGLAPAAEADRRTWIRRVYLDLHGLPPSHDTVDRFLADTTPGAFERVVDDLLASPRYAERYAQHWLDVVRYADTHGYEVNTERPNAWPYRDWCIAAFQADLPYDRFVREQIAGGPPGAEASTGFLVTAAVLLPGQIGQDEASKRAARQDALADIVINVSDAILGLTVGCARCHDHKFDPISSRVYYSLQAFFAGVEYGERMLETPQAVALKAEHDAARSRLEEIDRELPRIQPLARAGHVRPMLTAAVNVDRFAAVRAKRLRFTVIDTNALEPCIDELEVFDERGLNVALASAGTVASASGSLVSAKVHELAHVNDGRYGNSSTWMADTRRDAWVMLEFPEEVVIDRLVWGRDRTKRFTDRLAVAYRVDVCGAGDADAWTTVADSTDRLPFGAKPADGRGVTGLSPEDAAALAALESEKTRLEQRVQAAVRDMRVFAGSFQTPHPVHLLHRGDPEQPREELAPRSPESFGRVLPQVSPATDAPEQSRREAVADWLTAPANPLPARVMANRIWQWHFGTGLVDTPNDLGRNGSRPTHPELLDWLASEFVAGGWSIKHLHRLIVLSAAYRQGNAASAEGLAADADCRLLWRFPPRRLEAETIRDAMLAASGRLNLTMGGRGFDLFRSRGGLSGFPPIEHFEAGGLRRMIYAHRIRMEKDDVFGAFDCPDAGQSMARRRQSTTAIQALNLFNSPFTLDEAAAFAARVEADVPGGSDGADPLPRRVDRMFEIALGRPLKRDRRPAGERLVVPGDELGLPVPRLQLAHRAGTEDDHDVLRLRGEVRRPRCIGPRRIDRRSRREQLVVCEQAR